MARFFLAASNIFGGIAYLTASDLEHIKVLRIRRGEIFTVCDGEGTDYTCRLKEDGDGLCAEVLDKLPSSGEPTASCAVYTAFSKGDKAETVIQKCVEIGASEIVLFPSDRCVSRPDGTSLLRKLGRWQKIAEESAKQSGRGKIPRVSAADSFETAVKSAAKADLPLFFYEEERRLGLKSAMESQPEYKTISILTGPEGGFTAEEAEFAQKCGMLSVSLGPRILRCETAPVCGLAAVMLFTGNM